jgi:signal transduction histidine kinase
VIKHARADDFSIVFVGSEKKLSIECKDNGIGMIVEPSSYGLGMKNMLSRGQMLGASVRWMSPKDGGLITIIDYYLLT